MKKTIIASIIALTATAASAWEIGVTANRDYGTDRNGAGVTIGHNFGPTNVEAGFERSTKGTNDQDRYSAVVGYEVAKFGPVTITPKLGAAYLENQSGADGYAVTAGLGADFAVTKQIKLSANIARQYGQDRVSQFDGNRFTVGVKYGF